MASRRARLSALKRTRVAVVSGVEEAAAPLNRKLGNYRFSCSPAGVSAEGRQPDMQGFGVRAFAESKRVLLMCSALANR